MRTATPLTEILERDWDRQLFAGGRKPGIATQLGWRSHWTFNSKGSAHGFPDRTLVRDRVIFAELKRDLTGRKSEDANRQPTAAQVEWLDRLAGAGGEVYLVRPSHLDEFARVLAQRGRPNWVPSCAWKPELWIARPDCWIWSRAKTSRGYGNAEGRVAHRVTYEEFRGPITDGHDLHHLCGQRACVNPWHLTALPHDLHASVDSANGRKEFCAHGHPFDQDNTYVDKRGHRHCRTCRRDVNRRWRGRADTTDNEQQTLLMKGA